MENASGEVFKRIACRHKSKSKLNQRTDTAHYAKYLVELRIQDD